MTDERMTSIKIDAEYAIKDDVGKYPFNPRDVLDLITELEQYRKVVGCMGRGWDYWFISDSDAKANNLDIAALKERK